MNGAATPKKRYNVWKIARNPNLKFNCPTCSTVISYETGAPKFCSQCGESLSSFLSDTQAPDGSTDAADLNEQVRTAGTIVPKKKPEPIASRFRSEQIFDEYRLVRKLGSGGMGVVWEAVELDSERHVAIKLLSQNISRDHKAVERFVREGKLAARLSHPRSTFVFKSGEFNGQSFIVMELMPGDTLKELLDREGSIPTNQAVDYTLDIIDGLIAAHEQGMIHRDIKPSNCFLDSEGRAKLGDFGLSKSLTADVSLTKTGEFMGTPLYAAPEQIRGAKSDHRTDQYALGATLYALIAGKPPFAGDAMSVTAQIVSDKPPSLRKHAPDAPKSLETIIGRTLEKQPLDRFESLEHLRAALLPFASHTNTFANLGRRLAAYFIDVVVIVVLTSIFSTVGFFLLLSLQRMGAGGIGEHNIASSVPTMLLITGVSTFLCQIAYFSLLESLLGFTAGKFLMGLWVRNQQGARANLLQTFLRALVLPAGFGIGVVWAWAVSYYDLFGLRGGGNIENVELNPLMSAMQHIVAFAPGLVCWLSMRKTNGYLGLHEMFSRTRTERFWRNRSDLRTRNTPIFAAMLAENSQPKHFGNYLTHGIVADTKVATVYAAQDEKLHRKVWIYEWKGPRDIASERINLARIGRSRWLQGGTSDDSRWDAFESVDGSPLHLMLGEETGMPWSHARFILLDLAKELKAADDDGSVPDELSLEQIWVDASGHAKLLDDALTSVGSATIGKRMPSANENNRARQFLAQMFQRFSQGQVLPISAQSLGKRLQSDEVTLAETVDELQQLSERPGSLKWDDRFGVWAVSVGIEFPVYTLIGQVILFDFSYSTMANSLAALLVATLVQAIVAFCSGYFWENGSPVFQVMGIQVANTNGNVASPFKRGLRNVCGWVPVVLVFGFWLIQAQVQKEWMASSPAIGGILVLGALFLQIGVLSGTVFSILQPERGPHDFVAGTRLVLQ